MVEYGGNSMILDANWGGGLAYGETQKEQRKTETLLLHAHFGALPSSPTLGQHLFPSSQNIAHVGALPTTAPILGQSLFPSSQNQP